MSWKSRLETEFTITCGDGKKYTPLWKNPVKTKNYNTSKFNFINKSGTFVGRRQPQGTEYNFTIYFQGDNHLEISKNFQNSADDPRYWVINHPFYDYLNVQPLSMKINNSKQNISEFSISAVETLLDELPKLNVSPLDSVKLKNDKTIDALEFIYAEVPVLDEVDKEIIGESVDNLYNGGKKIIDNDIDFKAYFNAFTAASNAVNNAFIKPLELINLVQQVIVTPVRFLSSVQTRVKYFVDQAKKLSNKLDSLINPNQKTYYEIASGTILSSIALSLVTNSTNTQSLNTRKNLLDANNDLADTYNDYLVDLETISSNSFNNTTSFLPDFTSQLFLEQHINNTISLFPALLNSFKQERKFILEHDNNPVNLTHRFLGLTPDDKTLDEFIRINEIGLNRIFTIPKETEIIYYI